jgi:hypothetical protein
MPLLNQNNIYKNIRYIKQRHYALDNFHSGNEQVLAQDLYSGRPAQDGFNFMRQGVVEDGSAPGLISSNGQNWKDMRRFTLQTLRFEKIHFRGKVVLSKVGHLSSVYIGEGGAIMPATTTGDRNTLVLALATLGSAT